MAATQEEVSTKLEQLAKQEIPTYLRGLGYDFPIENLNQGFHTPQGGKDPQGKEFKGWYLVKWFFVGDAGLLVFKFGDWREGSGLALGQLEVKPFGMNIDDSLRQLIQEMDDAFQEEYEKAREAKQKEVASEQRKFWDKLPQTTEPCSSGYLQRKHISTLQGARFKKYDSGSVIFVPMHDASGKIWGLQSIREDGGKSWPVGCRTRGVFSDIKKVGGGDKDSDTILLCEGWATGISLFEASGRLVRVAFSSGNLPEVAKLTREQFPNKKILICGDNDSATPDNPGKMAAESAAGLSWGSFVIPLFLASERIDNTGNSEKIPTDFNDLHCLRGVEGLREILEKAISTCRRPPEVYCHGFHQRTFFVSTSENGFVNPITKWDKSTYFALLPDLYWRGAYPKLNPKGHVIGVNWDKAMDTIMSKCRAAGYYDDSMVRGRGLWVENSGDTVDKIYHMGDKLMVNGKVTGLHDYDSDLIFIPAGKVKIPPRPAFSPDADIAAAMATLQKLNWKNETQAKLLMGWIVCAIGSGATEWRPHVWVTGPHGVGKSTIAKYVLKAIFSDLPAFFAENATEAAVRQTVQADSIPVIMDEMDQNQSDSERKVREIFNLIRVSSSGGSISRGSQSGKAQSYTAKFSAFFSGINPHSLNSADQSRFTFLEMAQGTGEKDWKKLKIELMNTFSPKLGHALFWLVYDRLEVFMKSAEILQNVIAESGDQRMGQQLGSLLAGFWVLENSEVINITRAEDLLSEVSVGGFVEKVVEDQLTCLQHLLDASVRGPMGENCPVSTLIENEDRESLWAYGLAPRKGTQNQAGDCVALWVSRASQSTKRLFKDTAWSSNWTTPLSRLPGAAPRKYRGRWGTDIPWDAFAGLLEIKDDNPC